MSNLSTPMRQLPKRDERIVYTIVQKDDGRTVQLIPGTVIDAFWTRLEAEADSKAPYHEVVPIIIDMDAVIKEALATLTPVHKLALGLGGKAPPAVKREIRFADDSPLIRSDDQHLMRR